jgi:hypothetical protein
MEGIEPPVPKQMYRTIVYGGPSDVVDVINRDDIAEQVVSIVKIDTDMYTIFYLGKFTPHLDTDVFTNAAPQ